MPRTLILHIGLEKTGTTSFQHFCSDHAALLARHGLLYPMRNKGFGVRNHAPLASAYVSAREPDFTMSGRRTSREAVVGSLLADVARHPAMTVLLSSEHLSSRFDPPEARALADDMRDFAPRVMVVLREHRARFFSSYATHVLSGGVLPLEEYAAGMLVPGKRDHCIAQMLGTWEEGFGRDAIDLVDYDAQDDIVPALLGRYGIGDELVRSLPRYRDLAGLPPSAIEVLRCANVLLNERQGASARASFPGFLQRRYFLSRIVRRLSGAPRQERDVWRLDAALLARLDAMASADRDWLARHHGFALQPPRVGRSSGSSAASGLGEGEAQAQAAALVEHVTRGRWRFSGALVAAARLRR